MQAVLYPLSGLIANDLRGRKFSTIKKSLNRVNFLNKDILKKILFRCKYTRK